MKRILFYLVPVLFCFGIGAMAGWLQSEALVEWYPTLVKSPLTPPAVVFPVAWSIHYLCMGISLGAVLAREELLQARSALVWLWLAQLAANFLWSVLFFDLRNPTAGLIDIALLDMLVFAYVVVSWRQCRPAAWLFVPTCSGCSSPPTSMPTSGPSTKVRRPLCGPRAGIPEKFVSLRPKTRNLWQAPIL